MFSTKKDLYKYLLVMGISTMVVFSGSVKNLV